MVAFDIQGDRGGETADELFVIFNANEAQTTVTLPEGSWNVYINGEKAGTEILDTITGGSATVEPISAMVLVRESGAAAVSDEDADAAESSADTADTADAQVNNSNTALIVCIVAALIAACGGGIIYKKRKK